MIPTDIRRALAHRWPIRVKSIQGTLSPFEIVRVTGSTRIDGETVYSVGRPTATMFTAYLVLGPLGIGPSSGDEGVASDLKTTGMVQYDTGSTPAIGQEWGPQSSLGTIKRYRYGFRIMGDPTTIGSFSVVPARQFDVVEFLCKANELIAANGDTGAISVYDGNQADTSIDVSGAVNRTGVDFASGDWGKAMVLGGTTFVEPWVCP